MPKVLAIQARPREGVGRGPARRLRRQGLVPGVLYGKRSSLPVVVDGRAFVGLLRQGGEHALFELQWEAGSERREKRLAVLQEIQRHPYKDLLLHVDFREIDPNEPLQAEVEVAALGTPAGVAAGGFLEAVTHTVRIECLPKDLPEILTVDVSHLELGESVHAQDIPLPPNLKLLSPPNQVIFTVVAPEMEETVEAGPVGEPELVRERKETEDSEQSG
jgi:large subunit ribosomal protein L25